MLTCRGKAMSNDKNAFKISLGILHSLQQVSTSNDVRKHCFDISSTNNEQAFFVFTIIIDDELWNNFLDLRQLIYMNIFLW